MFHWGARTSQLDSGALIKLSSSGDGRLVFLWKGWDLENFFFSFKRYLFILGSFPHSSFGKEPACNAGDLGLIPGSGRSSGEGNGNPLQYSCLENPIDRGAWRAIVHGMARVRRDLATKPPPEWSTIFLKLHVFHQIITAKEHFHLWMMVTFLFLWKGWSLGIFFFRLKKIFIYF